MPDAPDIPVSLRLQITMFSKGFHGYLSLTSMVLKCISYLLYEKIFILKSSGLYMKLIQLLNSAMYYSHSEVCFFPLVKNAGNIPNLEPRAWNRGKKIRTVRIRASITAGPV